MIREVQEHELEDVLQLYLFLHEDRIPEPTPKLQKAWDRIINDPNHYLIVAIEDNRIVSSCVCLVVPNLSREARPYAVIENVVTHKAYRRKGLAAKCLKYAKEIAMSNDCYKIMLLTSHKEEKMLNFYRKSGFNTNDKTGMVQWLDA